MRHAMGTYIANDKTALQAKLLCQRHIARLRGIACEVEAIEDYGHMPCRDTACDQVVLKRLGQCHNFSGASIEKEL